MEHLGIKTTQLYAKLTNQKINEDMKLLTGRMTDKFKIYEDENMPVEVRNVRASKHLKNKILCNKKKIRISGNGSHLMRSCFDNG